MNAIPEAATTEGAERFLTFFLADEEYAMEILKVQEIVGLMPITPVPRSSAATLGVINLRGKIVPVLDLRRLFRMPPATRTDETCIVITRAAGAEAGLVVDRVSDVMPIPASCIQDVPDFGEGANSDFLRGVGKTEERVKLLLDTERVVAQLRARSAAGQAG